MKYWWLPISLLACGGGEAPLPQTAFYHWETVLEISEREEALLGEEKVKRMYVKAFDVSVENGVRPSALLEVRDTPGVEVVPVIFITNEVFGREETKLAERVAGLLVEVFPFPYMELQIDCDWTARTRVPYFSFLRKLGGLLPDKTISCTVRLHQYRDRERQGIPPVDRAALMAYNTGDLGSWLTENSIVDTVAINNYTVGQPVYPIPLDVAVAAYDWAAAYRDGELAYLINEPDLDALADTSRFTLLGPTRYRTDTSTYLNGTYLYRGDLLRHEVADFAGARRLAGRLWERVAGVESRYVIYYRVGSRRLR